MFNTIPKAKLPFKGLKKQQKNSYYKGYYKMLMSKYNNLQAYRSLFECENQEVKHISTSVGCSKGICLGDSKSHIINQKGKPASYQDVKLNGAVEIILYRDKIANYRIISEYHFYNERLFYYSHRFSFVENRKSQEIKNTLIEKYCNGQYFDLEKKVLKDSNNHALAMEDNVDLTIKYIDFNTGFKDYISSFIKNKNKNKHKQQRKAAALLYNYL